VSGKIKNISNIIRKILSGLKKIAPGLIVGIIMLTVITPVYLSIKSNSEYKVSVNNVNDSYRYEQWSDVVNDCNELLPKAKKKNNDDAISLYKKLYLSKVALAGDNKEYAALANTTLEAMEYVGSYNTKTNDYVYFSNRYAIYSLNENTAKNVLERIIELMENNIVTIAENTNDVTLMENTDVLLECMLSNAIHSMACAQIFSNGYSDDVEYLEKSAESAGLVQQLLPIWRSKMDESNLQIYDNDSTVLIMTFSTYPLLSLAYSCETMVVDFGVDDNEIIEFMDGLITCYNSLSIVFKEYNNYERSAYYSWKKADILMWYTITTNDNRYINVICDNLKEHRAIMLDDADTTSIPAANFLGIDDNLDDTIEKLETRLKNLKSPDDIKKFADTTFNLGMAYLIGAFKNGDDSEMATKAFTHINEGLYYYDILGVKNPLSTEALLAMENLKRYYKYQD